MILRNCEWVDEPHEEPEKVPRKRFTTDARAAASRANGAKSKGPTSDTGRTKVKFNAVQHGAACKEILFLEGEDEPAFWAKVDRIVAQQVPRVTSRSRRSRPRPTAASPRCAINANAIAVTEKMDQIVDQYDDNKLIEVRNLIPQSRHGTGRHGHQVDEFHTWMFVFDQGVHQH